MAAVFHILLGWALAGLWIIAVFILFTSTICFFWHPRRRQSEANIHLPPLRMIRPVCGDEFMLKEGFLSALAQDHPSLCITVCAAREDDPAVSILRQASGLSEGSGTDNKEKTVAFDIGKTQVGDDRKINNMANAVISSTENDLIFTDSNSLLSPEQTRNLHSQAQKIKGIASAMPEGILPGNLAAFVECAFLNQHHLRMALTGDLLGVKGVHGKAMAFSRGILQKIGGLEAISQYPGDDIGIMMLARKLNIPCQFSAQTVHLPVGKRSWSAVWGRQKRWAQARWRVMPFNTLGEVLTGAGVSMLAGGAALEILLPEVPAFELFLLAAVHLGLWIGADALCSTARKQAFGWRSPIASLLREFMNPVVLVLAAFDRQIVWRGHRRKI